MDEKILALQDLLKDDTLDASVADNVSLMIRREKEKQVLQQHTYKIAGPFKSRDREIYRTTAPWMPAGRLNRNSYDDLIDALYEHYCGNPFLGYTVQQMFEAMIQERENAGIYANLTITHYKADWKKFMRGEACKNLDDYEKDEIKPIKCDWVDKPVRDITPSKIWDHYKKLTAGCKMKRSTFNNVRSIINAVFDYAIIHDVPCIKAKNVGTSDLRFAPENDKWEGVYSLVDRQKILEACEKEKPTVYTKAIELMFCLDIRIGELRALYKEDVDLDKKTIYIGHQMVDIKTDTVKRHSERTDIMKGKADAGKRLQPLSKRAVSVIEWLFEHYPNSDWLLPSNTLKTPIRTHRFNDNLKRICEKKAGVKYFSSHGIRFHNISAMYDAGINEKDIQRMSGHTTADMTRHYNKSIKTLEDEKIRQVLG